MENEAFSSGARAVFFGVFWGGFIVAAVTALLQKDNGDQSRHLCALIQGWIEGLDFSRWQELF